MSEPKFPPGWDAARAERLIEQYDSSSDDELAAEDEAAAAEQEGQVIISVPESLLPAIRQLLASHKTA